MTRPRVTPAGALLLFVTEPQQLDAVVEYGVETLSPASIDLGYACPVCETDEHDTDEHESLVALDEDADRYEEN
jgi:hypothetical protein